MTRVIGRLGVTLTNQALSYNLITDPVAPTLWPPVAPVRTLADCRPTINPQVQRSQV